MFTHRPKNQKELIRKIQAHAPGAIRAAKKEAKFAESEFYLPHSVVSLRHLLDICNAIRYGRLKEWRAAQDLKSQKELGCST